MRKRILIPGIVLLTIVTGGMALFCSGQKEGITIEIYEVPGGYGYLVKSADKLLIRQDIIPSLPQRSPFCSYDDAMAVAVLVKQKILEDESPAITKEELKALHVRINCLDLAE